MSPKMSNEEIIITAKTVDEALSKAEAEYGSQGDISYEILEMPKKGFFGIGSAPAKIKVTINREQESILSEINSDRKNAPKPKNTQPRRDGADRAKNQPKPQRRRRMLPRATQRTRSRNLRISRKTSRRISQSRTAESPLRTETAHRTSRRRRRTKTGIRVRRRLRRSPILRSKLRRRTPKRSRRRDVR